MDDTFTLKCGKTLHLKPLKQPALRHLILKFGPGAIKNPESILQLGGTAQMQALQATEQLFSYCAGWGVEELPSDDEVELLRGMGLAVEQAHLARVNWLRFLALEDDEEAGALIGAVMTATFAPKPEPELEPEPTKVDELEAQVAELQAQLFQVTEKEGDGS